MRATEPVRKNGSKAVSSRPLCRRLRQRRRSRPAPTTASSSGPFIRQRKDGRGHGPLLHNSIYPPTFDCNCCARFKWSFNVGSVCEA